MEDKELIQVALGVRSPWFVKDVKLSTSAKRMDIYLDFIKGSKFPCPICGELNDLHDTKVRTWKHLDFFHYEAFLHARVPRIKCNEHNVKMVHLPWARSNSGFSLLFETLIVTLCKEMPVSAVAGISNVHEDSIWRILSHYVDSARKNVDLSQLNTVGVDELSIKKGHQYITLFYDLKESRVIHIENGKSREVFNGLKDTISEKIDPEQIKYLSMDMYPAYKGGAKEYFPNTKIVYDKFHIIKLMNDTIDKIRRNEYKTNKTLGKTRFIWLKNPERLSESEKRRLYSIKDLDTKTSKAYQFKIALQRLWTLKETKPTQNYFQKWYYWATHSNIKEITRLAKTIDKHFQGILESIKNNLNNGVVEGLNNKIKTTFKRSYGVKTNKYRETMIYLTAGKLNLPT